MMVVPIVEVVKESDRWYRRNVTVSTRRVLDCMRSRRARVGFAPDVRCCAAAAKSAGQTWRAMVRAVFARRDYMAAQAAQFELTLPQAHLLRLLSKGPARTMAAVAEALACDASNVTGIVDRLEARHLIVRRSAAHDRRVRTIALTPQGLAIVDELTRRMLEPPESFLRLTAAKLSVLGSLVHEAVGDEKNVTAIGTRHQCSREKARQ
jgi:MarR family transcriptional regulator, organic hydroperoxide resistance regulator